MSGSGMWNLLCWQWLIIKWFWTRIDYDQRWAFKRIRLYSGEKEEVKAQRRQINQEDPWWGALSRQPALLHLTEGKYESQFHVSLVPWPLEWWFLEQRLHRQKFMLNGCLLPQAWLGALLLSTLSKSISILERNSGNSFIRRLKSLSRVCLHGGLVS